MAYHPSAMTPLVRRYAPRSLGARGPVPIRPPFLGDITSSALSIVNTSPLGTVTRPLTTIFSSLKGIFGTGDVSPFQDQQIKNLADLAARGNLWALQALMGESGRWGLVMVDGGRTAHLNEYQANLPNVGGSASDSTRKWWLEGASNWGGQISQYPDRDLFAGPTSRYGSTDLAYKAAQAVAQGYGVALPPPTMQPFQGGYKNATNAAGYNIGGLPADEVQAAGGVKPPLVFRPVLTPPASITSAGNPGIAANLYGTPQLEPAVPPGQSGYATQVARSGLAMGTGSGMGSLPLILGAGALAWVLLKGRR